MKLLRERWGCGAFVGRPDVFIHGAQRAGGGADDFLAAVIPYGVLFVEEDRAHSECCFRAAAFLKRGAMIGESTLRETLNFDLADGRCAARMNKAGRCSSVGRATDS